MAAFKNIVLLASGVTAGGCIILQKAKNRHGTFRQNKSIEQFQMVILLVTQIGNEYCVKEIK
jgi:hypothetical protein